MLFILGDGVDTADGVPEDDEDSDDGSSDSEDDEDFDPIPMEEVMDGAAMLDIELPAHQRCGAHITNLLATKDTKKALDSNSTYKKHYDSTETKLKKYVKRQSKSDLVADEIKKKLGKHLIKPGGVRWNSEFDSKTQVSWGY